MEGEALLEVVPVTFPGRVADRLGDTCCKPFKCSLSFQSKSLWFMSCAIISETRVGVSGGGLTHILDSVEHFCQQESACGIESK